MNNAGIAQRIKAYRIKNGFSQEELSEKSGLSLRSVQRIENGETEPRGDSLRKLADAFNVAPDEIIDWTVQEDAGFLMSLNLSALSFLLFPLLGILVPLIVWISKKGKIKQVDRVAKELLNFQITWTMIFFICELAFIFTIARVIVEAPEGKQPNDFSTSFLLQFIFFITWYLYNIVMIIINTIRINKGKEAKYFPKIRFMK